MGTTKGNEKTRPNATDEKPAQGEALLAAASATAERGGVAVPVGNTLYGKAPALAPDPAKWERWRNENRSLFLKLEQRFGRPPNEGEIAREMGLSLEDYQTLLGKVRGTQLVYLEDMSGRNEDDDTYLDRHVADTEADPLNMLRDARLRAGLVQAIKSLPEREQYIMSMYYEQDMNLKEIAAVLGVTESRVCQLHSQSIARLRTRLREW